MYFISTLLTLDRERRVYEIGLIAIRDVSPPLPGSLLALPVGARLDVVSTET